MADLGMGFRAQAAGREHAQDSVTKLDGNEPRELAFLWRDLASCQGNEDVEGHL